MKKTTIIVTEQQLKEYVEKKKAQKTFDAILEDMHKNSKNLNENISVIKANQLVIENYKRKKMLTPRVQELLKEHKLLDENVDMV